MKLRNILIAAVIMVAIFSCATTSLLDKGNAAYQQGDYALALQTLEQIIDQGINSGTIADSAVYFKAGMAAQNLGQQQKAENYLKTAFDQGFADEELFISLMNKNREIDNLTREIYALEAYHTHFPEGAKINSINKRLFETYIESEQWVKANTLWPEIESHVSDDVTFLEHYLKVNKKLYQHEKCDEVVQQILTLDADNLVGMEWQAVKYYNKADDRYVSEMKAYQENKTRKQYKKLLAAWDLIWPDYRKARDYFEKLYTLSPNTKYARFLGNIYSRMDKKDKATYWYKRAEE